jgi:uncharacterized protein involved in outer membrane biogenesis
VKTGKIILIIIAIIVVAGFAATWFLVENLDRMVKETVQEVGTEQLDTDVGLNSVSISIPRGRVTLSGLQVANPAGYSDGPVFELGSIDVDLDLTSLYDEALVIEEITIRDPQVNFELNEKGVSNLDVLAERLIGSGPSSTSSDGSKLLIIDRLDFKGGTITARAAIRPDEELTFDFPVIFMTDLGKPDGATADEIGAEVAAVLLERSMSAAKRAGVQQLVDRQKDELIEKGKEKLDEKLKDILKRD